MPRFIYLYCYHMFCTEPWQWLVMLSEKTNSSQLQKKPPTVNENARREPRKFLLLQGTRYTARGVSETCLFLLCWRVDQGGLCYHASHLLPYKSQQRESARGDQARQDNKRNLSKLVCVLNISRWTYYSSQVIYVLLLYKQLLPYTPPQLPICHMGTHAAYKGDFSNVFQMLFLLFFFLIPQPSQIFSIIFCSSICIFSIILQIVPQCLKGSRAPSWASEI